MKEQTWKKYDPVKKQQQNKAYYYSVKQRREAQEKLISHLQKSRDLWRLIAGVLFVALVLAIVF